MTRKRHYRRRRAAMTLLELMLALSLSVLVLMAVGMAIDLHFRMLDVRRTNVEEAQVARAALNHIAADLRGAVQYVAPDLSGLQEVTGNAANAALNQAGAMSEASDDGGDTEGETGDGSSGILVGGMSSADIESLNQSVGAATEATAELGQPVAVVGLFGSPYELRFDVSRLPRVDEYEALLAADSSLSAVDIPSDVKTVTYFLAGEESLVGQASAGLGFTGAQPASGGLGRGLMRAETAQAVATWAEMNGQAQSYYDNAKLLADEVVGLEFRYFDGLDWLTDWDSDALGGLPKAVEILLTIQPTYALTEQALARAEQGEALPPDKTYRLVVHLPLARPGENLPDETAATTDAASGEVVP